MKNLLFVPALLALAACGMSEDKFAQKVEDKTCETCASLCDVEAEEGEEVDTSDCDFDAKAAKECLDGEWTCEEMEIGEETIEFPVPPEVCGDVYVCGDTDTDGEDTDDTDDTDA